MDLIRARCKNHPELLDTLLNNTCKFEPKSSMRQFVIKRAAERRICAEEIFHENNCMEEYLEVLDQYVQRGGQ
jgi:hypothetical protein